MYKICVYGLWHLGLVTTAGLLQKGFPVIGLDDFDMSELNKGHISFHEPHVESALITGFKCELLKFTNNYKDALQNADIVWITFDTPIDQDNRPNSMFIWSKIMSVIPYIRYGTKIVISSQVPIGFTEYLREEISVRYPDKKIYVAYSPENLQLGNAVERFVYPDCIIVGTNPDEKQFFEMFFKTIFFKNKILWMTIPSAEMTKHAINAYLAMSICFANEIAQICDETGALSGEVEIGLKSDKRIGERAYVKPGDVYSGGTLARDVDVLETFIHSSNYVTAPLLSVITASNYDHKIWIRNEIMCRMGGNFNKIPVMVFGLSYKDGTNTLRRSGPIELCEWLYKQGAVVYAYDPSIVNISEVPDYIKLLPDIAYTPENCRCIIFLKDPTLIMDEEMINTIGWNRLIIDPNGYLQSRQNSGNYFSVRRLI